MHFLTLNANREKGGTSGTCELITASGKHKQGAFAHVASENKHQHTWKLSCRRYCRRADVVKDVPDLTKGDVREEGTKLEEINHPLKPANESVDPADL